MGLKNPLQIREAIEPQRPPLAGLSAELPSDAALAALLADCLAHADRWLSRLDDPWEPLR